MNDAGLHRLTIYSVRLQCCSVLQYVAVTRVVIVMIASANRIGS